MEVELKLIAPNYLFEVGWQKFLTNSFHKNYMVQRFKKLPPLNKYLVLRILKYIFSKDGQHYLYIFPKSLVILKNFIGFQVMVYKGNLFRRINISKYILGYKFGEFTHTRKPFNYPIVKKKNKNIRR